MKKVLMACALLLTISGCQIKWYREPVNIIVVTRTPTAVPEITPVVQETPVLIPAGGEPDYKLIFSDEFNSTLQAGWEWQNEKTAGWSLDSTPGALEINVTGGYVNLSNASNVLLRDAPEGDFQVETLLKFYPWGSDQFAGLILYDTNEDFLQSGYAYCNPVNWCVGRGLYMDSYKNGDLQLPRYVSKFENSLVYLRLERRGNTFNFLSSEDGGVWFRVSSLTTSLNVKKIGVVTGQNLYGSKLPAIFEYFHVGIPN